MGTITISGRAPANALYMYEPLGGAGAYAKAPTSALLLLAVEAVRLSWRFHAPRAKGRTRDAARRVMRTVLDVARGRRAPLTTSECCDLTDGIPQPPTGTSTSMKLTTAGWAVARSTAYAQVGALAFTLWEMRHERYDDRDGLLDLSRDVLDLVAKVAVSIAACGLPEAAWRPALSRLHLLEARCLMHAWTKTLNVIPEDKLLALLHAPSAEVAERHAGYWGRALAEPAPAPGAAPFGLYKDSPTFARHEAEAREREAKRDAEASAEIFRRSLLTNEQRDEEDRQSQSVRYMVGGLVNRCVN